MRGGAAFTGATLSKAASRAPAPTRMARRVFAALKTLVAWLYGRNLCRRARMLHPSAMDPGLIDPGMSSTPKPDSMILLDDVHLTLASDAGAVNVLRGISLAVAAGETVSVVGPSGSGKSTMMMIVGGLERPSAGRVVIAGTELGGLDEDALARFRRDHVGIVFQSFHLIPTMNALENVAIPLELAGRRDAFALAEDGLAAVGLGHRLLHYPGQLSGGEQQRVALARAFATTPRLLLADEPTGNLDTATGRIVIDLLFTLQARHGTTLVLITHDAGLAQRCDRIIRLADGRVVDDGTAAAAMRAG
jgi:putative ABC transport system ATP-binding protein